MTNTILVVNPKGGSGKTTITLNLASYYAASDVPVAVMDYDPQGSSLNWLRLRPQHASPIHAANAARAKGTRLRSMAMYVPPETRHLIIDAPAGASGVLLQEMLDRASCIIVPVPPSVIDIHATANFVRDVLFSTKMRARNLPVAIVANKVRRSMPRYQPLDWFLETTGLELVARLIDSDVYLKAVEAGAGIFEMESSAAIAECRQFLPLIEWVESHARADGPRLDRNVYELPRSRSA